MKRLMATGDSPQKAFARFVRRAIDDAKNARGWTVNDLAAETGVGRSTLFRWLAGDWQDYPELAKVQGFCAALDVPVSAAFNALKMPERPAPNASRSRVERDLQVILDRLTDPSVSLADKRHIREALRRLATRPVTRGQQQKVG
jgi:transcriptional regulator with XRE-family HTH domain